MINHQRVLLVIIAAVLAPGLSASATIAAATAYKDGEEKPPRGKGWSQPAACRVETVDVGPHTGKRCLRIDLNGDGWKQVGWNWFGWYPTEAHTDASAADELVFWLKASRADAALRLRLVDNQKGATEFVDLSSQKILPRLPTGWQQVHVPLALLGGNADRSRLWEVHLATETPGDLTLWVDDIGFEAAPKLSQDLKPFAVHVKVESARPTHAISPYIYGASAIEPMQARELGLTTVRWGGNPSSRYNWRTRSDNAGADWFFLNRESGRWSDFVTGNRQHRLLPYLTVPMLPWVAKGARRMGLGFSVAKYGPPQRKVEPFALDRGDGVHPDGRLVTGNDPRDTSVPSTSTFQSEGIRTLPPDPDGPPRVYGLDNEMMLWHSTHRDLHPTPVTYDEALRLSRDYALAIKQADSRGLVAGPCAWGWTDLTYSAADEGSDRFKTHADNKAHGGQPFLPWYLAAMKSASAQAGRRLLDLVDVHFYPQARADGQGSYDSRSHSPALRSLRIRSTRALWDPAYRDESWIGEPVMLIPRLRAWIEQNDPGLKLCLGEYCWGGDDDPSGAIAQAEILGTFARERVDHAFFWVALAGVQKYAFQLYCNPDGHHNGFGDRYLASRSDAPDRLNAFAARRADGALTVVLINKDLDHPAEVRLDLGAAPGLASTLYRLPNPPGPIVRETLTGSNRGMPIVLPPLTGVLLVAP